MSAVVVGSPTSDEESPMFWLERCIESAIAYKLTITAPDQWWKAASSIALMDRADKTWGHFVEHDGAGLRALAAVCEGAL